MDHVYMNKLHLEDAGAGPSSRSPAIPPLAQLRELALPAMDTTLKTAASCVGLCVLLGLIFTIYFLVVLPTMLHSVGPVDGTVLASKLTVEAWRPGVGNVPRCRLVDGIDVQEEVPRVIGLQEMGLVNPRRENRMRRS